MDKQELLNCAADYIEKNGKVEGSFFAESFLDGIIANKRRTSGCPACAVGAAIACLPSAKTAFEDYDTDLALNDVVTIFGLDVHEMSKVYDYSDSHTQEEVVAWLREGMPL